VRALRTNEREGEARAGGRRFVIDVDWRVRAPARTAALRRAALHAAESEGFRAGRVCIAVVGRRAMAALHLRHCGAAGPTDVLTFDLGTERRRGWIEGAIVTCADVARRSARRRRIDPTRELALYVTHGVLHLAGYDDESPHGFERMHRREDELLAEAGLGAAFDAGGHEATAHRRAGRGSSR
jgi:probable rRNA maturation factor